MNRKSTEREAKQNLDPFLDIITNVIGLLVIFAALVGLSVGGLESTMGFPVRQDPADESEFVDFCCFDGKIAKFDHDAIFFDEMIPDANDALGEYATWEEQIAFWNERTYRDDSIFLESILNDGYNITFCYGIREYGAAETFQELCSSNSRFVEFLKTKDPERDIIYFYANGESFSVFKKARELAREMGFKTGWRPFPTNRAYMRVKGDANAEERKVIE